MNRTPNKDLIIRDEVHGDMAFSPLLKKVIDHRSFQRLRGIKQLGLAEYVFPGATHTRFQHSLGASYLARRYFDSLLTAWLERPFQINTVCEGTVFYAQQTFNCLKSVNEHAPSYSYWKEIASLSGLLHDIGHGPWSHTFENLAFKQNYAHSIAKLSGTVRAYFDSALQSQKTLLHEDLSVLYIYELFNDLEAKGILTDANKYSLCIASLVNQNLVKGELQEHLQNELAQLLEDHGLKGGIDLHRLLRPLISGPFDVDRMDYIQRDGRNCGVDIGAIEWRRIVSKLMPCLADHEGGPSSPSDVVLLTSLKNQHVLDDFIFSLFQMYTQVYLHPMIVGFEQVIKHHLERAREKQHALEINLSTHQGLSDEGLRNLFIEKIGISEIEELLYRQAGTNFEVAVHTGDKELEKELIEKEYARIKGLDRPMLKEKLGVFVYTRVRAGNGKEESILVHPWAKISPIAKQFHSINYSPNFWIQSETNL